MNYLKEILHRYSPIFAALASLRLRSGHALREIFRVSVAALPRWASVVNILHTKPAPTELERN